MYSLLKLVYIKTLKTFLYNSMINLLVKYSFKTNVFTLNHYFYEFKFIIHYLFSEN